MKSKIFILLFVLLNFRVHAQLNYPNYIPVDTNIISNNKYYYRNKYYAELKKYSWIVSPTFYFPNKFQNIAWDKFVIYNVRVDKIFQKEVSFETFLGGGTMSYQGAKIMWGFNWNILNNEKSFNFCSGISYSLGLPSKTALSDDSYIVIGYNNYIKPFFGFNWWFNEYKEIYEYPEFSNSGRFLYLRFRIGYNYLLGNLKSNSFGNVNKNVVETINVNLTSCPAFEISIGCNIPDTKYLKNQNLYFKK